MNTDDRIAENEAAEKTGTETETVEQSDGDGSLGLTAQRLNELEDELARLREDASEAEETIEYYKKAVSAYKSRLQARELMEVVLPYISDMLNEISEQESMEDLRLLSSVRLGELVRDLEYIGVKLKMHNAGDTLEPEYICNLRAVPTTDKNKVARVAKCTRLGCEFRDGSDPVLECLDVYKEADSEK